MYCTYKLEDSILSRCQLFQIKSVDSTLYQSKLQEIFVNINKIILTFSRKGKGIKQLNNLLIKIQRNHITQFKHSL